MTWSKYALIALSLVIMLRCIRSMLSSGFEAETWATARFGRDSVPVTHWENLIGRARSADIRIDREDVERIQAVLRRRDDGRWTIYDVFSRGGVSVNGEPVTADGAEVESSAAVKVGGATLRLQDLGALNRSNADQAARILAELRPGDLVFANEYPGAKSNHVGIVIGFAEDGEPLVAHCSPSFDGVVVTRLGDSFSYFRRFAFMTRL